VQRCPAFLLGPGHRRRRRWQATRAGLPHATVSRLSFTLSSLGYLRHRPASGECALSPAVLSILAIGRSTARLILGLDAGTRLPLAAAQAGLLRVEQEYAQRGYARSR